MSLFSINENYGIHNDSFPLTPEEISKMVTEKLLKLYVKCDTTSVTILAVQSLVKDVLIMSGNVSMVEAAALINIYNEIKPHSNIVKEVQCYSEKDHLKIKHRKDGSGNTRSFYHNDISSDIESIISCADIKIPPTWDYIPIVLYGDSIQIKSPLMSHRRQTSLIHFAYRILHPNFNKKSSLDVIRTLGVSKEFYQKDDKFKDIIETVKLIIETNTVRINKKELSIRIKVLSADNLFYQDIFLLKKSFGDKGGQNCKCCLIKSSDYNKFLTCKEVNHPSVIRKNSPNPLFNYPLNIVSDSFHDLQEGVLSNLLIIVLEILFLEKIIIPSDIFKEVIRLTSLNSRYNDLKSVIDSSIFETRKKTVFTYNKKRKNCGNIEHNNKSTDDVRYNKVKYPLSGSQQEKMSEIILRVLDNQILKIKNSKLEGLRLLLGRCLYITKMTNFKGEINENYINNLEVNIDMFFKELMTTFKNFNLSMKYHNLLHYPLIVKIHGNMSLYSTIRFESSHTKLKNMISKSKNFKNISFSIMKKYIVYDNIKKKYNMYKFPTDDVNIDENYKLPDQNYYIKYEAESFSGNSDINILSVLEESFKDDDIDIE
uniref:C2 domain-containing protein n=1 Tax=Strongyloides papillosus TaxID=174720 RepID=A0A0N5BBI5_STREA